MIVDKSILKLVTRAQVKPDDCSYENFVCILNEEAKRKVISEITERLETGTQYKGKNMSISNVILSQAREIASFLRNEGGYEAFTQNW
uniref:Uncharacterized protein n=1 Tax=Archaeoglobus fulgidus TaxID=2234 RepID=A0A7J2TIN5_ARCFL